MADTAVFGETVWRYDLGQAYSWDKGYSPSLQFTKGSEQGRWLHETVAVALLEIADAGHQLRVAWRIGGGIIAAEDALVGALERAARAMRPR